MTPAAHIWRSIRHGQWHAGFATRKAWPGKPQFAWVACYYDGHHWAIHIGPLYVGCSYY